MKTLASISTRPGDQCWIFTRYSAPDSFLWLPCFCRVCFAESPPPPPPPRRGRLGPRVDWVMARAVPTCYCTNHHVFHGGCLVLHLHHQTGTFVGIMM